MYTANLLDQLHEDCRKVLASFEPPGGGVRFVGGVEVLDLLVWNVVISSVVRIASSLTSNALWEKLKQRKGGLLTQKQIEEHKGALEQALGELKVPLGPHQTAEARAAAQQLLVGIGWPEPLALQGAQQVAQALAARLGTT